ncbi:MAG TPA: hypothetical protein VIL46_13270 [Gemmataceae bacterium]
MDRDYFAGLDLAQAGEFTALAVLERSTPPRRHGGGEPPAYALRHLRRFPIGTLYAEVAHALAGVVREGALGSAPVLADLTGVGRGVLELLRKVLPSGWLVPVLVTAGHAVGADAQGSYLVPRKELVTCLQLLLQQRRLRVAPALPEADLLVRELTTFRAKVTPAGAREEELSWREGAHDDLVLAVALACWWAERHPPWGLGDIGPGLGESRVPEELRHAFPSLSREEFRRAFPGLSDAYR